MPVLRLWFDCDSHTLVVKRATLREVQHTECCVADITLVLDRKVEPLVVTSSVGVDAHIKWEISRVGLDNHVQVARFEIWVEEIEFLALVYLSEKGIRLDVWGEAEEGSLWYLELLMLANSVEDVLLGRKTHMVGWIVTVSPRCRLLVRVFPMHHDWVGKSLSIVIDRERLSISWICAYFELLVVKVHWNWRACDVIRSPPKNHIRLHAIRHMVAYKIHRWQQL